MFNKIRIKTLVLILFLCFGIFSFVSFYSHYSLDNLPFFSSAVSDENTKYKNFIKSLKNIEEFKSYDSFSNKVKNGDIVKRQEIYIFNSENKKEYYDLYFDKEDQVKRANYIMSPEKDFFIGEEVKNLNQDYSLVLKDGEIYHLKKSQ